MSGADVIVTPNEANLKHGIGVLVERFFGGFPNTLSIRSQDSFGGEQNFGTHRLRVSHAGLARWESYEHVLRVLNGSTVRRLVCIPFFADDLITAICLHELFNCPLCIYVMDDNNVGAHGIADDLFAEALWRAKLRLAISPEMRDACAAKFGMPFHVLPPLVEPQHVVREPEVPEAAIAEGRPGALVGNVWSGRWFESLRATVRSSGVKLQWYGNINASWLKYSKEDLASDGISAVGFLPEENLIERLRGHPYAVMPSGSLDEHDDRPELARLSLPSRLPFLAAVANLPVVVLGDPETSAARFVKRFQVGRVCPYNAEAFKEAVAGICDLDEQWFFRRNAAEKCSALALENPGEWIWRSLERGAPVDERFEQLMPRPK